MKKLLFQIKKLLREGSDIFLVGKTNSGKSYFAKNILLDFLKNEKVIYLAGCNQLVNLNLKNNYDYLIVDEVEILFDRNFLENLHKEKNFYTAKYLAKIKSWHKKLSLLKKPAVYIVTRNKKEEIAFLCSNLKTTEWNKRKAKVLRFDKKLLNDQ